MANPKLSAGDAVPTFQLESDDAGTITSDDLKGRKYVLYFYPKDDTPGCTTQACDFRDNLEEFEKLGYEVIGVSPDNVTKHAKFRDKYELNFSLLEDSDHATAEAFGVWREKKNYGKTYTGLVRSTFVVGDDGVIQQILDNVKAKGHVDRLIKTLNDT